MTKDENRTFLSHPWAELWCTNPPSRKNGNFFVKIFFRFSLAVIAIENDDEGRKQNFSISPMGGVMVYQTLPAEKNEKKKKCQRFFRFSLAVIAIENDDEGRKQNFIISPMGGVMVYQTLSAEKMKKKLSKIFFVLFWLSSLQKTMTKAENRTLLSHPWAELWCTKHSQQKK